MVAPLQGLLPSVHIDKTPTKNTNQATAMIGFIWALPAMACLLLALAGLLHLLIEIGVFLWADVWLSPVEMVGAVYPWVQRVPWIAHPEHYLGVHRIVMSPYFGLVAMPVGAILFYVFLYLTEFVGGLFSPPALGERRD